MDGRVMQRTNTAGIKPSFSTLPTATQQPDGTRRWPNPVADEREAVVAYLLRYAARHADIRRAALEVAAEHIEAGYHRG